MGPRQNQNKVRKYLEISENEDKIGQSYEDS